MSSSAVTPGSRTQSFFACAQCARRKQRCDKLLPVCTPCRKAASTCSSSEKEKGVVQAEDQSVIRKGPVRLLEERVAELEQEARAQGLLTPAREPQSSPIAYPTDINRSNGTTRSPSQGGAARQPHRAGVNMASLSLSAMAEPRSRAGEFLKELSMPRIIAGMTETYGGNPEKTSRLNCIWDGIARDIRHPDHAHNHQLRLNRDEAHSSLETYFTRVDLRYPRVQVDKVRSGIAAITAENDSLYTTTLSTNPAHIFMAYMVIAVVPLVSDIYPVSHGSFVSTHIMAKCMRVLDSVFREEDGVDVIQCLHLLVVFAIHSSAAGSPWHLIGFAMSKCIALGYHRESGPSPTDATDGESEQRKWAFWSCYFLDALICGALDRPMSIDERSITASLPAELIGSPTSETMLSDVEIYQVRLFKYARLMALVIQDRDSDSFNSRLSRLLHWDAMTPSQIVPSADQARAHETSLFNSMMLRLAIHHIVKKYEIESGRDARHAEIRRVRLYEVCRAVVKSLTRYTMSGRSYLSMITGYTSLSAGLAIVYCRICADIQDSDTRDLLGSVGHRLDIVARQFPKMEEYGRLVQLLSEQPKCRDSPNGPSGADRTNEMEQLIAAIGPEHLKKFAFIIAALLRDDTNQLASNAQRQGLDIAVDLPIAWP